MPLEEVDHTNILTPNLPEPHTYSDLSNEISVITYGAGANGYDTAQHAEDVVNTINDLTIFCGEIANVVNELVADLKTRRAIVQE